MRTGKAIGRLSALDLERFLARVPPYVLPWDYAARTGRADHDALATVYRAMVDRDFCRRTLSAGVASRGRDIRFGQ